MRATHITSSSTYRTPFGACPLGESVTLSIDVWDVESPEGEIRLWVDGEGETLVPMMPKVFKEDGERMVRLTGSFTPKETQIIWYYFNITADDGTVWRYGASNQSSAGEGAFALGEPRSFQITVYKPRLTRPMWYQHGIVYQIFPDRFDRGSDWRARVDASLAAHRNGPGRSLVEDWNTKPTYHKDQYGRISTWDFYGGNLEGVRERLGYLKSMGISVIYLNPIFEAYSNHRYDTGDYEKIDPVLGTEEDFRELCSEAGKLGIHIINDGVFSHTGSDSKYFNRENRYPGNGAYNSQESPYYTWFRFIEWPNIYNSWWGFNTLPEVEELSSSFDEYINGDNGIIRNCRMISSSISARR